jgi:transposase
LAHANAKLTFARRKLIVERILAGWTQAGLAEAQGGSRSTVSKWWRRFRAEGDAGLRDRCSRPHRTPHALAEHIVQAICRLRCELGVAHLDRTTRSAIHYERRRRWLLLWSALLSRGSEEPAATSDYWLPVI